MDITPSPWNYFKGWGGVGGGGGGQLLPSLDLNPRNFSVFSCASQALGHCTPSWLFSSQYALEVFDADDVAEIYVTVSQGWLVVVGHLTCVMHVWWLWRPMLACHGWLVAVDHWMWVSGVWCWCDWCHNVSRLADHHAPVPPCSFLWLWSSTAWTSGKSDDGWYDYADSKDDNWMCHHCCWRCCNCVKW